MSLTPNLIDIPRTDICYASNYHHLPLLNFLFHVLYHEKLSFEYLTIYEFRHVLVYFGTFVIAHFPFSLSSAHRYFYHARIWMKILWRNFERIRIWFNLLCYYLDVLRQCQLSQSILTMYLSPFTYNNNLTVWLTLFNILYFH